MHELVLLMDEKLVTNSLIVSEKFGKRHDNVMRDIENLKKDVLNFEEMFTPSFEYDAYNRTRKIYIMNRDGWTLLVMGFTGNKAMKFKLDYIEAFNKMEESLKNKTPKLPMTYKEALLKLVEAEEEKEAMQLKLVEQQPKVDYYHNVLQADKLVTSSVVAKDLGISAIQLHQKLKDIGILYKRSNVWMPYAKYQWIITEGYADYHINEHGQTLKWTEKGREWIINLFNPQITEAN